MREESPGTCPAEAGVVTISSKFPRSMPSSRVMILVVLAGYMRSEAFLSSSTSPLPASMSTAACA